MFACRRSYALAQTAVRCIAWLGLRRNICMGPKHLSEQPTRKRGSSRKVGGPGALDCSRVACDLERIEVLLELNGPAVADRPHVGDLCFAFLSLPVKFEVIVAESHNSLAAVALKDFVRVKDEFVETRR